MRGVSEFCSAIIGERRMLGLPPFTYACLVRVESKSLENNQQILHQAVALLPSRQNMTAFGIAINGPVDALMAKKTVAITRIY